ncbi:hypothetical protein [Streptomyces sp. CB02959]|uniref:hypothetical protein n=1 Tax=Streptomyces sp. CB02959 TaxID=2020330 RepID=UPI0011AF49E0|nr:hypothetical protein [Streptomyces sp. CB02959]
MGLVVVLVAVVPLGWPVSAVSAVAPVSLRQSRQMPPGSAAGRPGARQTVHSMMRSGVVGAAAGVAGVVAGAVGAWVMTTGGNLAVSRDRTNRAG